MAEFALGLTKTAVAGTVSRVKSAIEEETKLRVSVHDDLVFITGEFEMMQAFLSASSAVDGASKNLVARMWVRQLRHLASDVEDCVEFIIHLDKASRWDWTRRLVSPVRVCMGKRPLPLDVAAEEIKRLKARVEDVSQRNTRYNLVTLPTDAHHQLTPSTGGSSNTSSGGTLQALLDVWTTTGRLGSHTSMNLKKLIHSDVRDLQVISLWRVGSADVGDDAPSSSLGNYVHTMKKVYDDPVICQRFKNRAWVKLTPLNPFNPVDFVNNLLSQFRSRHEDHDTIIPNNTSTTTAISELLKQLSKLRYLVVLEQELNTIADWDAIRTYLPVGNQGSRVVVSTNSLGIALVCTGATYQVTELQRFSHDQGIYAFSPKGCGHLIGMSALIWQLRRCAGVISVSCESEAELHKFNEMRKDIDAVEFERRVTLCGELVVLDQVKFAREFILGSSPDDLRVSVVEELEGMSGPDIIKWCHKLVTECTCLVFIEGLISTEDWDSIKQVLLCESTRCRIVVIVYGRQRGLARHYANHDDNRALKARDLIQGNCPLGDAGCLAIRMTIEEMYLCDTQLRRRGYGKQWTLDYGTRCTVSMWGIAGVGKTYLAREMYKLGGRFYDRCGWVDVPYPFDLTELCRRLLLDFHSHTHCVMESVAVSMTEGQDPIEWCCKILRANKCLLVLDGLRSTHDWDVVKATLLSQPTAGQTVVITREETIATYSTGKKEGTTWNVIGLDEDDALLLFQEIACDCEGKQLSGGDPDEQEIFKLVVSKCGGLPQVIAAVAKSIRTHEYRLDLARELNSDFVGILQTYSSYTSLSGLFSWMHSYFDALPDELKPCIFYMLVFPADESIRWRRLLSRWIAEGYIPGGSGTAEKKGLKLLLDLRKLSILYTNQRHRKISSKLNGFFREYIKSSPMEDNLVLALEESRSTSSRLTGQHLTIRESWERDSYEFSMMEVSRLRSLTVCGEWKSFLISDKMKLLRVLDLEGTTSTSLCTSVTDGDLDKILKSCLRLKFLSLRECLHVTRLPESLGEMRQLQTLDVRYTSIVELPSSITKLQKLQYIRAGPKQQAPHHPSPPPKPQEGCQVAAAPTTTTEANVVSTKEALKRKPHDLVTSSRSTWQKLKDKQNLRRQQRVAANGGGGVELLVGSAAEGIGRLIHLHTLGVVNVAGGGKGRGLVFLKELKMLSQLRKLGLSGVNNGGSWRKLCDAISELHHLESLSLQLEKFKGSYGFACFNDRFQAPESLKRLKVLYGEPPPPSTAERRQVASIGPAWINKLPNLERFDHELTISTQQDISDLSGTLLIGGVDTWCLRIKPVEHLSFEGEPEPGEDEPYDYFFPSIIVSNLIVECSGHSKVTFGERFRFLRVQGAINIHCCCCSPPSAGGGTAASSSLSCGLEVAGLCHVGDLWNSQSRAHMPTTSS